MKKFSKLTLVFFCVLAILAIGFGGFFIGFKLAADESHKAAMETELSIGTIGTIPVGRISLEDVDSITVENDHIIIMVGDCMSFMPVSAIKLDNVSLDIGNVINVDYNTEHSFWSLTVEGGKYYEIPFGIDPNLDMTLSPFKK